MVKEMYKKIHLLVIDDDFLYEFILIVVDYNFKMQRFNLLEINE
jgi:hypothetical protein